VQKLRAGESAGGPAELPARLAVFLASDRGSVLTGKLLSAPHDSWHTWDDGELRRLASSSWLTLRRLDPYTVGGLQAATGESGS
jgi:hypothetical protein